MVARRWRKHPEDDAEPIQVTPMDWENIRTWQEEALRLRKEEGLSIRQIAKLVGKCFSQVQRTVIPGAKTREHKRKAVRERERRHEDVEYAERVRTYQRKYNQVIAPTKWVE